MLTPAQESLLQSSPCLKVEARKPLSQWKLCEDYLALQLSVPNSTACTQLVPRIYHAVGKHEKPPTPVLMNAAANPQFKLQYLGDRAALEFVTQHCGAEAAEAYRCFIAPAFRADLYRYCALHTLGGVYMDTDLILSVPMAQAVSMCGGATLGHDVPQLPLPPAQPGDVAKPGMQMKILAGVPKHRLFRCMLNTIVMHVRTRFRSRFPMMLTGPQLLAECYDGIHKHAAHNRIRDSVLEMHVTYRDTRSAVWPYAGMMGARGLLAFEQPSREHFGEDIQRSFDDDAGASGAHESAEQVALKNRHYHELTMRGILYTNSCRLQPNKFDKALGLSNRAVASTHLYGPTHLKWKGGVGEKYS